VQAEEIIGGARGFSRKGEPPRVIGPLSVSLTLIGATGCCGRVSCITDRSMCADTTDRTRNTSWRKKEKEYFPSAEHTSYRTRCLQEPVIFTNESINRDTPGSTGT
jgi:hypothetical protein